jgi:hypothetical protein
MMKRLLLICMVLACMVLGCDEEEHTVKLYFNTTLRCSTRFEVISVEQLGRQPISEESMTIIRDSHTGISYMIYEKFPHKMAMTRLWEVGNDD